MRLEQTHQNLTDKKPLELSLFRVFLPPFPPQGGTKSVEELDIRKCSLKFSLKPSANERFCPPLRGEGGWKM